MSEFPQVLTFYSFKGGVGRSMAVLNVAYALAARGRNVLVLDMDLEAPGLSGFLRRHDEIEELATYDMVDLLEWAARFSAARREGQPTDRSSLPPLTDYVVSVKQEKLESLRPSRGELGRVDVIPVDEQRDYYTRLTEQAIGSFDHDTLLQIGRVLNFWLKSREFAVEVPEYYGAAGERTAKYDYVLVDSRTGVTEIGGLCIGPLSDQLVVFTGLNDQNVAGTHDFLKQVGILEDTSDADKVSGKDASAIHRLDPKPTMIVATPVPSGELKMKEERLKALRAKVGTVVGRLSYHPQLALMETVFVRDHPNEYLALEYGDLVERVMRLANDGTGFDAIKFFSEFIKAPRDEQRGLANQAIRFCSTPEGSPFALQWLLQAIPLDSVREETDFVLLDRICRFLVGQHDDVDYAILNNWGALLSKWAFQTPASDQQHAVRRDAALDRHAQVLAAEKSSSEEKARAYINRGWSKENLKDYQGAIADATAALELRNVRAAGKAHALYNRGVSKSYLGIYQGAIADYTTVLEMPDAPAEQKATALCNRGFAKGKLGDHQGEMGDYTAVLEMPDAPAEQKAKALCNRGFAKGKLGDHQGEMGDYTAVLEMPDAPAEQKAKALYNRGFAKGKLGDHQGEMGDYIAVLEMPDAPAEQKAKALVNRGYAKGNLEDHQGAISDYSAVLEMPDAPAEQMVKALSGRGWGKFRLGQLPNAIADFRQAISIDEQDCPARGNLATTLLVSGQTDDALNAYEKALALAKLEDIAEMEQDLTDALEKQDSIAGAADVRNRLVKRRAELEK